jgi:hypothetical protein
MPTLTIIEPFQIFEDLGCGFLARLKPTQMDELGFQGGKEALYYGIVPAVTRPTHGASHAQGSQPTLVR